MLRGRLTPWGAFGLLVMVCAAPIPALAADNGIVITASSGLAPGDVRLIWSGGAGPYNVFRGTDARLLFTQANIIGTTSTTIWDDTPPPGAIFYYSIGGFGCAPAVEACDGLDNDCDGAADEPGSELSCNLPHATGACTSGACAVTACDTNFGNCDGAAPNGCETSFASHSNAPPGEFLGTWDADSASGFGCPNQSCDLLMSRTGVTGRYVTINGREASSCCAYVGLRFELRVPSGMDYDLHVSGSGCFADPAFSSTHGTGQTETIDVWCNDDCFSEDDSFTANVEVRYFSGASCQPWTLLVSRRGC